MMNGGMLPEEEKVFKDPVHKYIYVQDYLIWDLINTREFQRLAADSAARHLLLDFSWRGAQPILAFARCI